MAYVLLDEDTAWWPATITAPQDGGTVADHRIEVRWRLAPQEETDAAEDVADADPRTQLARQREMLRRLALDWRHVQDAAGQPVPFSAEAFGRLLARPYVLVPLIRSYYEFAAGAPAKNSAAPHAAG